MLRGLMMDEPLLVSSLIAHADKFHGDTEMVSRTVEGPGKDGAGAVHRQTYRDAHRRARQLCPARTARAPCTGRPTATRTGARASSRRPWRGSA